MNRKLKQQVKLLNVTLNTIVKNQALLYLKLEQLEQCILKNSPAVEGTADTDPILPLADDSDKQSE